MIIPGIKQAFRNLKRNKIYTTINIIGLGVSSAFIILVALYVRHAERMDQFSAQTKNIYRVEMTDLFSASVNKPQKGFLDNILKRASEKNQITTPVILAPDLKKNFIEVKAVTRFGCGYAPVLRVNNQSFKEEGNKVAEIDANFFSFMGLPLMQGNTAKPFENNNSAVISERAAKKYFGNSNPIGQTFTSNEEEGKLFTISAVAKDFPANSSLQFDIMTPIEGSPYYERQMKNGTNSMSHITLIELSDGTDLTAFQKRLNSFGVVYFKDFVKDMQSYSELALFYRSEKCDSIKPACTDCIGYRLFKLYSSFLKPSGSKKPGSRHQENNGGRMETDCSIVFNRNACTGFNFFAHRICLCCYCIALFQFAYQCYDPPG